LIKPIEIYDKTNNLYEKATEIDPNNSLVWFNKGTALNKLNGSVL
jgi:tetratricopeptide (TPR) repeat protein